MKNKRQDKSWDLVCKSCEELNSRFALKDSNNLIEELDDFNQFKKNLKISKDSLDVNTKEHNEHSNYSTNSISNDKELESMEHNHENHKDYDNEAEEHANHEEHNHNEEKHEHEHTGHENHDHSHGGGAWWKLAVGWILFIPFLITLFFSTIGGMNGPFLDFIETPTFQFVDVTIIMIIIGSIFWRETITDALHKKLSVDVLVAVSSTLAYIFSTISFILILTTDKSPILFFEAVATILVIIYSGRFLEDYIKNRTLVEIDEFMSIIPKTAILVDGDELKEVEASSLKIDDVVLVRKGEQVPSDGVIIDGTSIIQEANFTGEANSLEKAIGDKVIGSTVSMTGNLKVKITKLLDNSVVSEIIKGIQETSSYRPQTQKVADKIASYLIPFVVVAAVLALLFWGFFYSLTDSSKNWYDAFSIMIAVMVIACPCSLGLATPSSILAGTSIAAKLGIYFNSKDVFESFKKVDKIILDKTGTITTGKVKFISTNISTEYLELIYNAERNFSHPLAKSIVDEFKQQFESRTIENFKYEEEQSLGISITHEDEKFYFGSEKFLKTKILSYELNEEELKQQKNGNIVLFLFNDKTVIGHIVFGDQIKETSKDAIAKFMEKGIEVYMITGDNPKTANYIASQVGIKPENVFAETMPNEKATLVKELKQQEDKFILFVGDGNNDTLAMAEADLSISMNSGTDLAIQMSDVTILENDLNKINDVMYLTDKTLKNIYRGLYISIAYNFITIPLAMASLITPFVAAFVMMFSDTIAIFNALALRIILFKKEYRKKRR